MVKNLSFSYSKMGMYKECPQKYKFRYVHFIPELPKYYFAFGSALHSVMEFIYNPQRQFFPTLAEALAHFDSVWSQTTWQEKGYASVDKELAGYAEGRTEITAYYQKHAATFAKPLSVEMKSTLEIDGLSLISILDRMDYLGNGLIKILDYKTGKTVQREPDQLYMYQKVAETSPAIKALVQQKYPDIKEIRVGQLAFYHLPSLTEMTFERAPDKEIAAFWQKVLGIADDIRAGKFEPNPDEKKCQWCDYRNICPVYTHQEYTGPSGAAALPLLKGAASQQAFAPAMAYRPAKNESVPSQNEMKTSAEVLTEKIDRYGQLVKEQEKLRAEIIGLLKENNYTQYFGMQYKAILSHTQKTVFKEHDKVVELLKKYKLLEKTLVPTQTTILALLDDPNVSPDVKEKLRALGTVQTSDNLTVESAD